jgi:RNA polymerase primary sigma factor
MLNRKEELALAQRLENARQRYRHAVLWNGSVLARVVETFERIQDGELLLDRSIDVIPSLDLSAERIQGQMPHHLRALRKLLRETDADFLHLLRARTQAEKARLRRRWQRRLRKAVALAEQLSPRTELLDRWAEDLERQAAHMRSLAGQVDEAGRSAAEREQRTRRMKELRDLVLQLQATPEQLEGHVHVLRSRRTQYQKARRELAEANLRLVVSVAKRYRGQGLPFADLIQEGNSGLMRAVDKFDYRLGFKFGTYATWWIRQGVTRALSDLSRTVRVPCHQIGVLGAIERVRGELTARNGHEPDTAEIAAVLGITPEEIRALRTVGRPPVSLDDSFGGEEGHSLQDFLSDAGTADLDAAVDQQLLKDRLAEVLNSLAPRDREVIELRFGLRDGQPRSLIEVAEIYGITRERVRQIESRGLLKLRKADRRERLAEFVDSE